MKNSKRKLKTFIKHKNMEFGDYILFQEYEYSHDTPEAKYLVSKPIMAIYLGIFVADQAVGFNYVRWNNDNHTEFVTNEYVTNAPICKQVGGIENHIEWDDYIDILGYWKKKPKWKQIIKSYRKQNLRQQINNNDFKI